ncbi:MAG: nitronate monooxygenase [Burkholderiaceae bacterium]|nr:nitronate monooxygenase [Burkholderiaceae bacterium]
MRTPLCEKLGCELPIFAFSHCRDVVVEVTKAGGFGVIGASTFSPEQLEAELRWIDQHVDGRPYGVDVIIPTKYDKEAESTTEDLENLIPDEHRAFMDKFLDEEGVPQLPPDERARIHREIIDGRGNMTPDGARRLLRVALAHPQVRLVVSALGSPPPDVVAELRARNVMIGAMCGKGEHAASHKAAGVQVIVAQGTEAGGHTGEIATMVLVPQVVEACGDDVAVLAAGGIAKGSQIAAALALGAQGVWCGTVWLGTRESELDSFEKEALFETRAQDAVRRKARTGKTVRMIKSKLSEAWEQPGAPAYLPTPLQGILYNEAHARVVRAKRKDLYSFPVGQVVGMMHEETTVRDVMYQMQLEYLETMERLRKLDPSET